MLKFSTNVLVMLPSALSTWSLLCDGRHILVVVILFQFLACLRVHSVEGSNGGLWLLILVVVLMKSFRKEIFISERAFALQGGASFWVSQSTPSSAQLLTKSLSLPFCVF